MRPNTLKSVHIQNLLSFGPDSPQVELGNLNVLIGPNASGKSNFIQILELLRSTPKDLAAEVGEIGGISELLWKGKPKIKSATAKLEAIISPAGNSTIRYQLAFTRAGAQLKIVDERIENEKPDDGYDMPYPFFEYNSGRPVLRVAHEPRHIHREEFDPQQSILSQRQDPDQYPEVTYLGRFFGRFRFYRNWDFGPSSQVRDLYGAELKSDFLDEDNANLALMLNNLWAEPKSKAELRKNLKMFYDGAEDISTRIQGGLVDLRIEERGEISIPASRASDGTLRWLCLLAILLHPEPPPVVCIEEPEMGLHPDAIRILTKLLSAASERTQLFVTTHSDALVDEVSGTPDAVIVCEKRGGSSTLTRLDPARLSHWLKRYTLGQLWRTGEIGGNRW